MNPQENEPQNQQPTTPPISSSPPEPSPMQAPPVQTPTPDPQAPQAEPVQQQPEAFAPIQEQPVVQSQSAPTQFAPSADTNGVLAQQPDDPGRTLGLVGLVLSLLAFGPISLVISIIARQKSKKAGHSNGLALAGIILSVIGIIVGTIVAILLIIGGMKVADYCQENGRTVKTADGSTMYECNVEAESDTTPVSDDALKPEL